MCVRRAALPYNEAGGHEKRPELIVLTENGAGVRSSAIVSKRLLSLRP